MRGEHLPRSRQHDHVEPGREIRQWLIAWRAVAVLVHVLAGGRHEVAVQVRELVPSGLDQVMSPVRPGAIAARTGRRSRRRRSRRPRRL